MKNVDRERNEFEYLRKVNNEENKHKKLGVVLSEKISHNLF